MKKLIAIILTLCLLLSVGSAAVVSVAATPNPLPPPGTWVYFYDKEDSEDVRIFFWSHDFSSYWFDWPGVPMEKCGVNEDGETLYKYNLEEYDVEGFIIDNSAYGREVVFEHDWQTVDIDEVPYGGYVSVRLTDETNEMGYYRVKTEVTSFDPEQPTEPIKPAEPTEPIRNPGNLIILDTYTTANHDTDVFDEPLYICCRVGENGSTVYAEMEYMGFNEYGMDVFRFTAPEETVSYYFTDGKKRTIEKDYYGSTYVHTGDWTVDENGYYNLWEVHFSEILDWYDIDEPSSTTFARFDKEYHYSSEAFPSYRELYAHCGADGAVDWVLFYIESNGDPGMLAMFRDIIGSRMVDHGAYFDAPFPSYYGLYDAVQDTFVTVDSDTVDDYDGLAHVFDEVGDGKLLGDLDGDDSITVIDATILQRCEANLREYPEDDELGVRYHDHVVWYYSDFNRDGERNVLDATCIQRYLAGMPFKIG